MKNLLTLCPKCRTNLSNHLGVEHSKKPEIGSLTVCAECLSFLEFTAKDKFRLLTNADFTRLHIDDKKTLLHVRAQLALSKERN